MVKFYLNFLNFLLSSSYIYLFFIFSGKVQSSSAPFQPPSTSRLGLPPQGHLIRRPAEVESSVLALKRPLQPWILGKVHSIISISPITYRVKYLPKKFNNQLRNCFGNEIAICTPATVIIPVSTRVVALFDDGKIKSEDKKNDEIGSYYSGIIAEYPKSTNKNRYLVFYDDGHAQYVKHQDIYVVTESSPRVWDDLPIQSRDFVKNYLDKYPEIPMTKLSPDQRIKTEWMGKWWMARVVQVDANLVQMYFEADKRTEWIYRGSARLEPLYIEALKLASPHMNKENLSGMIKIEERPSTATQRANAAKKGHVPPPNFCPLSSNSSAHSLVATKKITKVRKSEDKSKTQQQQQNIVGLPPNGTLIRQPAEINNNVLVMKHPFYPWLKAKVQSIVSRNPLTYCIKYNTSKETKNVTGRELAIFAPAPVIIPVGTRVVSIFEDDKSSKYYSGVIGESPNTINNYRYLVFFDDGYCQYVYHDKICVVNESSVRVWEDVPVEVREFTKNYQQNYPKRQMMKVLEDQVVKTECKGKWYMAKVLEVDASLAQMDINKGEFIEWIYRGSTRFWPLFQRHLKDNSDSPAQQSTATPPPPVVEKKKSKTPVPKAIPIHAFNAALNGRSVAKKSTTKN